ncbi:MAG: hypothetical protein IJO52_04600 [Clostridia bacterium]|nr:hypothetical protein [Clostridia bacterium]
MKNTGITSDWELYEAGREYNRTIGLYETIDKNERFYRGDQWHGVTSGGLPTPVFNIFKRVINYFISAISSQKISFNFSADSVSDTVFGAEQQEIENAASVISSYLNYRFEKDGIMNLVSEGLLDAALSGDMFLYVTWDSTKRTTRVWRGDFVTELVDTTRVFFGDVNSHDVQSQPYIIISGRDMVERLREEAKENGIPQSEYMRITDDSDVGETFGDYGKRELEGTKCSFIIKLYKENGKVFYTKSTRTSRISDKVDTGLTLYPLCMMNWDKIKNSYHGQAVATGITDNQVYINKAFAMVMKHMMNVSFSKVIYNANLIDDWTNTVGEAIAVNGNVESAAATISPGEMQSGFLDVINMTLNITKELLGATDAALGEVSPDNTSAIIALQNSASIPLENQRRALFAMMEQLGMIWLDYMFNYYDASRVIMYRENGELSRQTIDSERLRGVIFSCTVDAGASAYWSEISAVTTLDMLLKSGHISFIQYLERIPEGIIPRKNELIEQTKAELEKIQNERMTNNEGPQTDTPR